MKCSSLRLIPSFSCQLLLHPLVSQVSNSYSLSLPKRVVTIIVVKSLDFDIIVLLGCQVLLRLLRNYTLSFSFSNVLPRANKWFTTCIKCFCTSEMFSPDNILNISYSWMRVFFLALLASMVPSWVTSKIFQISLASTCWEAR